MKAVNLAFENYGEPSSCPLLILHGFLASSRNWRTIAGKLASQHHVYVLDMRNHGTSPHAEKMDYPSMATDIMAFMDNQGIQRAHLLGHSMGGKVAMWFALHFPERVERLLVADIAPMNYCHSFDAMIHALRQLPLHRLAHRKHAEQLLAEAIPDLGFRQFLLQNLLLKDGQYYWRINLDIIQQNAHYIVGFPELMSKPYCRPVLFIAGERSNYIQAEKVLEVFPGAEFAEISGVGHWLYVEAPDAFCRLVLDWLAPADLAALQWM